MFLSHFIFSNILLDNYINTIISPFVYTFYIIFILALKGL